MLVPGEGHFFEKGGKIFELLPHAWAAISSEAIFTLPNDLVALYGIPSKLSRKGLMVFGGAQIDPGYHGRIFASIYNPTQEPIRLEKGQKMFTVMFLKLTGSSLGYKGEYQNETQFPPEYHDLVKSMERIDMSSLVNDVHVLKEDVKTIKTWMKMIGSGTGLIVLTAIVSFATLLKIAFQ